MALSAIGFIGLLSAVIVILALTFYAFHLREHRPAQYVGFWQFVGSIARARSRVIATVAGLLLGALLANGLLFLWQPTDRQSLVLCVDAVFLLVSLLAISFGVGLYKLQQRK